MNGQDPTRSQNVDPADYVSAVKRTSWGAVFAGVVTAIGVQLLLSLLGAAIGFTTLYAATDDGDVSGRGMAIGAGIWWLLTSIISLFIGGWVAGRLSGVLRPRDAGLHGVVVWGLTALFAFYVTSTAMGTFMGGAMEAGGIAAGMAQERDGQRIIGMPAGPSDGQNFHAQVERDIDQLLQGAQTQPGAAAPDRERIMASIRANFQQGQQPNREELINVLAQSGIPRTQAEQRVDAWQRTWQQQQGGGGAISEAIQTVRERPQEVAEKTSKYLAGATWWSFFAMLLGAISAMVGGYVGTPQHGNIPGSRPRSPGSSGGVIT